MADYASQQAALDRRRALAQALAQQSLMPLEQSSMPGANVHLTQGLAKLAQALVASRQNKKLDQQQGALDTSVQTDRTAQMAKLLMPQADLSGGLAAPDPVVRQIATALLQGRQQPPRNIDPLSPEGIAARLEREKGMQALQPPAQPAPRNLDPLSPEGIAARLELARQNQALKPPETPAPRNIDPLSPQGIQAAVERERQMIGVRPQGEQRIVQVMGPNGTPIWVRESAAVGQPAAQAARAVTGAERQALAFYNRAKEAVDTLTATPAGGASLEQRIANQSTAGQLQGRYAPNLAQTSEQQAYRQAQRAFTEARLRKESGAAIPQSEFDNDSRTYFAQPGDSADTVEQKRKARQTVLDGLKFSSGKAYEEYYGEQGAKPQGGGLIVPGGALERLLK